MSNIRYITRENQLNKLIKDNKLSKKREYVLFTSLWDDVSNNLVKVLEGSDTKLPVSVLNSFDTPHSFVIWGIKKVPSLVTLDSSGRRVLISEHVTDIYKRLNLEK
jgi:hypothetical protein